MSFALSLLYAFLILLLPLAEAIYNHRSPGALLYLYWVESCALLILHPIRIWLHQHLTNATGHWYPPAFHDRHGKPTARKVSTSRHTFLKSFVMPMAIFTIAHGVFILLLLFLTRITGTVNAADLRAATTWGIGVPLSIFAIDLFMIRRWTFAQLRRSVDSLIMRSLVTQFGLIFGIIATAAAGSLWSAVAVFFLFRVLTDGLVDWSQRVKGKIGLSNRIARWVAKKENKSTEQVRAEFDASMKIESEFEAFLNQPFDPEAKQRNA
jgi:Family of unknown function (DUF6498)